MLPFLKNKEAMVQTNADDEVLKRAPDDGSDSFEMIDAIVEDMLEAVHSRNKKLLKSALEALCDHIKDEDEIQDESLTNKEV